MDGFSVCYVLHGIKMKKLSISSKKWVDRGGNKGYGWKTSKVPRYICEVKRNGQNDSAVVPRIECVIPFEYLECVIPRGT